jgi:protein phosphatase
MANSLDFAMKSHAGLVRPLNEDAVGADPGAGLFILADGLGGYNAGEIASTMAVSNLLTGLVDTMNAAQGAGKPFDPAHALRDALVAMNSTIFRAALNSAAFEGMATTVVIAWLLGGRLWIAHTGDSRAYRFRAGTLEQMTRDHSFSQELLDAGMVTEEEARLLPAKNLVTRALGASPDIDPEVHEYDVQPDDMLVLCSDGLTEMVSHFEISGLVAACAPDVKEAARRLVDMANEAGGRDNTSVIVIRIAGDNRQRKPAEAATAEPAENIPVRAIPIGTTDTP